MQNPHRVERGDVNAIDFCQAAHLNWFVLNNCLDQINQLDAVVLFAPDVQGDLNRFHGLPTHDGCQLAVLGLNE